MRQFPSQVWAGGVHTTHAHPHSHVTPRVPAPNSPAQQNIANHMAEIEDIVLDAKEPGGAPKKK